MAGALEGGMRVYLGLVRMPDSPGRGLEELKRQGIYDDSLILFTSDHGENAGLLYGLFPRRCVCTRTGPGL